MSYERLNSGRPPENPKENAGFFSLLTFVWLNDLLKQGNEKPLENDNLPPLLKDDQSQALTQNLQTAWLSSSENEPAKSIKRWLKTARLWLALLKIVPLSEKVLLMMLASSIAVFRVMQPLFLIGLLAELMKESLDSQRGIYLYASGVCLCTWFIAICKCHCDYRSSMVGMRMRSAILGLIYKKVGYLSLFRGHFFFFFFFFFNEYFIYNKGTTLIQLTNNK